MAGTLKYVQVILPLHLSWGPWYSCSEDIVIGTRVNVRFAGKPYSGVVSRISDCPPGDVSRILPIEGIDRQLENVLPTELKFWKMIADYYLCTEGDVYKTAYPAEEVRSEKKTRFNKKLSLRSSETTLLSLDLPQSNKPVVAFGWDRSAYYERCIRNCLDLGKDALVLSPSAAKESPATRRELSRMVRSDTPVVIEGSKSCLFLPFRKLGLIIVDNEHSPSYKHNASPRYNARDAAILLGGIHGAAVILGSGTPSLETQLNVNSRRYDIRHMEDTPSVQIELIDTMAENRKHGMVGDYSLKLLEIRREIEDNEGKYLEIESWNLRKALNLKVERYALVAVLHMEFLLSRNDFRSDEKTWQMLEELRHRCKGRLVIQSRNVEHPVLQGKVSVSDWLKERKAFKLPPYSRLVEIRKPGREQEVIERHFLPKDASLRSRKAEIARNTAQGYTIDVDPI